MSEKREDRYFMAPGETPASVSEEGVRKTPPVAGFDRRDFLKVSGFALAAASGCSRSPVEEAIPLLVPHPEMVPGRSIWYASTCGGCTAACGVLGKSRDGRPIKLEGNDLHPLSQGGLCAVGQASLLELYDEQRLRGPVWEGEESDWPTVDTTVEEVLSRAATLDRPVRLLTETIHGPSELEAIRNFGERFADFRHVVYDSLSCAAILDAHEQTFGVRALPHYRFEEAEVIASFDADFLATWISPVEFTAGYRAGRRLDVEPPRMSHHLQAEARLSLTGSNADERVLLHPTAALPALIELAARIGEASGALSEFRPQQATHWIEALADRLVHARGRSLVISGSQDVRAQLLCNRINDLLGNYERTLSIERPSYQRTGDDRALATLERELAAGEVEVLLVRGVNPVYDLPRGEHWREFLGAAPLVVSFARSIDETATAARAVCPEHHFLEDWRDAEPVAGRLSLTQPLIRPRGDTRSFSGSLLAWSGKPVGDREWMQEVWQREVAPRTNGGPFRELWDRAVRAGTLDVSADVLVATPFELSALGRVLGTEAKPDAGAMSLVLYPKLSMLDGRHGHNAWLQELPDPVSKISWDNYASLAPETAAELGIDDGELVEISDGDRSSTVPAHLQPGQHPDIVAVAIGYGRAGTDRFHTAGPAWFEARPTVEVGATVGVGMSPWRLDGSGYLGGEVPAVSVRRVGGRKELAFTQTYDDREVPERLRPPSGEPRPIVQETVLPAYLHDRSAGKPHAHHFEASLWPEYPEGEHHWGMAIDLSACTGCSGCVVACQVENNLPVVGQDEIRRRRDMYWMRIDRYYSESEQGIDVVHQPMLCHHCDNAPCESVCPVAATVHSEEGLNQQVYNRCVGTRYCANNCPYKVRRFNWFDYPRANREENLVLNPDVTVRSRGVMEKCSFCVQRIQGAKLNARAEGRPLVDGEFQTACQQSCPAEAIVFGDVTDPESEISRALASKRHYRLFEELNVLPSVGYLRLVRNRPETDDEESPHA